MGLFDAYRLGILTGANNSLLKISQIKSTNNGVRQQPGLFASGIGGLFVASGHDIIVEDSWFVGNAGSGLLMRDVIKADIENTHCDDTVSAVLAGAPPPFSQTSAGAVFLADVTGCHDVTIRNCTFNRNASEVITRGITIRRSFFNPGSTAKNSNFVIENCEFLDNTVNLTQDFAVNIGSSAHGCDLSNTNNVVFKNCTAFNNSTQSTTAAPQGIRSFGYDIFLCNDITVEDCVASGQIQSSVGTPTRYAMAAGFKTSQCNRTIFRRCIASNNQNPVGEAYGFAMNDPVPGGIVIQDNHDVFENCIAEANIGAPGKAAGFSLRNALNSKVINCFAQGNTIGLLTDEQKLPPPDALNDNNVVANNLFVANIQFGILDTTSNKTTAYYKNEAKKNGPTPFTTNYSGLPLNTPVRDWNIGAVPNTADNNGVTGEGLDNISMS